MALVRVGYALPSGSSMIFRYCGPVGRGRCGQGGGAWRRGPKTGNGMWGAGGRYDRIVAAALAGKYGKYGKPK